MFADADIIILGGGCAGLSLGLRLAEDPGACRRVMIIESRPNYVHDRTWCFWRLAPHRFDALIRHSWSRVAVRSAERLVVAHCQDAPYQMLASGDFYEDACRLIGDSKVVSLMLDTAVNGNAKRVGARWQVDTSRGTMTANTIIDTRPAAAAASDVVLWQSFSGQEITCTASPFDTSTVELMDFAAPTDNELRFTYLLPMTPDRALVETTVFGAQPRSVAALATSQADAVEKRCNSAPFHVLRSESGVLPMGWRKHRTLSPSDGAVYAGVMHGGARPATGYAFERIQRWAHDAARALRCGLATPTHRTDPLLTRVMDQLLLQVLRASPGLGPALFVALFSRADPARIIRFLSDKGTLADHVAMVSALPARPFLRALLTRHHIHQSASATMP